MNQAAVESRVFANDYYSEKGQLLAADLEDGTLVFEGPTDAKR